jgi:hypothetical protein
MNTTEVEAEKEPLKLRIDEARGIIEKVGGSPTTYVFATRCSLGVQSRLQISKLKYEMGRNYVME